MCVCAGCLHPQCSSRGDQSCGEDWPLQKQGRECLWPRGLLQGNVHSVHVHVHVGPQQHMYVHMLVVVVVVVVCVLDELLVLIIQDMRTLRFAHKQETHGRRGMYDRLQVQ